MNDKQLEVLAWVVAGCPEGVMTDASYKTSAVALASRGLVVVRRPRGAWTAEATADGRYFAEHGCYPPGPNDRGGQSSDRRTGSGRPVDELIGQLVAGGPGASVAMDSARAGVLIRSAIRHDKVPAGHYLVHAGGWSDGRVELCPLPDWLPAEPPRPVVPVRLTKPHPVVATLREDRLRLQFGAAPRQRALRLLQALVGCAVERGFTATVGDPRGHGGGFDGVVLTLRGHQVEVRVLQQHDKVDHTPTRAEEREAERYPWRRIPTHDQVPTERLTMSFPQFDTYWRHRFADSGPSVLEEQLGDVFREVEMRVVLAERRREEKEREAEERRRQWQQVYEQAMVAAREQHLAEVLAEQVDRWQRLRVVDAYLDAMRQRIADWPDEQAAEAWEWLHWAQAHRDRTDPLHELGMPADPKFTPDLLKPHMKGLSPYGPPR